MPEGPSILHLKDLLKPFTGKIVKQAGGYGTMPTAWIKNKKLLAINTWGKHLLFEFKNGAVKVHLGLFGEIIINERKKVNRSFYLEFNRAEINGYVVKAQKLTEPLNKLYDWRTDIMSKYFDAAYVKSLLKQNAQKPIHEVLMDQNIFTGVGNKIRNEGLYLAGIHPLSIVGKIPAPLISKLIKDVQRYARLFYKELSTKGVNDSFNVYQQKFAADGSEVTLKILPAGKRKLFYSEHRQKLFA